MKKRSVVMLHRFLKETEKVHSVSAFAKEFGVSTKTIYNDIQEINDFLVIDTSSKLTLDAQNRIRISKYCKVKEIYHALAKLDFYTYHITREERRMYIVTTLFMQDDFISMQSLADPLGVTRITTIHDFKVLKESFSYYHIRLISEAKKGVMVHGTYANKVRMLMSVYMNGKLMSDCPRFFQQLLHEQLRGRHSYKSIAEVVEKIVQRDDMVFLGTALTHVVGLLYVVINYTNVSKNTYSYVSKTKLDCLLDEVCLTLKVALRGEAACAYQSYLEEYHLHELLKSTNYIELYEIVRYFLSEVGKTIGHAVENDDLLIESLVLHIKNIQEIGELALPIKDDIHLPIRVSDIQQATRQHIHILEKFLNYPIEDHVQDSVLLHICASLVRQFSETRKLRVMIVCASSMATGKYMEAQIKNYFNFEIVQVSSAKQVTQDMIQTLKLDMVIASFPLDVKGVVFIQVGAKLTMDDLNAIQAAAFQFEKQAIKIINQKKTLVKRAEFLFDNMASEQYLGEFSLAFEHLIECYEQHTLVHGKTHIHQILKPKYIQKAVGNLTWETAIRMAAKPLLEHGYIQKGYIAKCIQNVLDFGDYIVVSPRVALAHAGSEDGVLKDGLSLLVSESPVFLREQSIVQLIFVFASTGSEDYTQLLKEIVALGKNKKHIDQVIASKNTIDIFYRLIK